MLLSTKFFLNFNCHSIQHSNPSPDRLVAAHPATNVLLLQGAKPRPPGDACLLVGVRLMDEVYALLWPRKRPGFKVGRCAPERRSRPIPRRHVKGRFSFHVRIADKCYLLTIRRPGRDIDCSLAPVHVGDYLRFTSIYRHQPEVYLFVEGVVIWRDLLIKG
jgi:hypothetical protein